MRGFSLVLASLVIWSAGTDYLSAGECHPGGGFMLGRIAMKRIKKMRGQDDFSGHDHNKDGALDRQEIAKAEEKHGEFIDDDTFKRIDANHDGMISHAECQAHEKELEEGAKAPTEKDGKPGANN